MAMRRKYSKEFKQEAVQMVSVPGVTLRPRATRQLARRQAPAGTGCR